MTSRAVLTTTRSVRTADPRDGSVTCAAPVPSERSTAPCTTTGTIGASTVAVNVVDLVVDRATHHTASPTDDAASHPESRTNGTTSSVNAAPIHATDQRDRSGSRAARTAATPTAR
ncbi:hypothetical protein QE397_002918 [Rhodococcus sp. SORGH_AS 301]|nr:hypothetical protein [Rhodococcus sp. SORGH_AS_0301]MDQ1181463.1 hypothetical protein [Rhodococcus sp. SORGH_AS_0301]